MPLARPYPLRSMSQISIAAALCPPTAVLPPVGVITAVPAAAAEASVVVQATVLASPVEIAATSSSISNTARLAEVFFEPNSSVDSVSSSVARMIAGCSVSSATDSQCTASRVLASSLSSSSPVLTAVVWPSCGGAWPNCGGNKCDRIFGELGFALAQVVAGLAPKLVPATLPKSSGRDRRVGCCAVAVFGTIGLNGSATPDVPRSTPWFAATMKARPRRLRSAILSTQQRKLVPKRSKCDGMAGCGTWSRTTPDPHRRTGQ